ncbi:MAG: S41 family peptidase [Fimbriimonadaceae bacterium]|nr:S41 family peptidase [Fimbriimonadaceae bacterium]
MQRVFWTVAGGVLAAVAVGQVSTAETVEVFGPRSLALSPDGTKLAFSWRGDLWIADSNGGRAVALTSHVEMEDNPVFSPDGRWIAFSSNRFGGSDIFVIPAEGGAPSRITYHPGGEVPTGWQGATKILFRASREGEENAIFSVDVRTLSLEQLHRDNRNLGNPAASLDGSRVLFTRFGYPWSRPRYEGSGAQQLWTMTPGGSARPLVNNGRQQLWPGFLPNGDIAVVTTAEKTPSVTDMNKPPVRWTDSAARTPNVYVTGSDGRQRRITQHVGRPARFLAVAARSGAMAYEHEGRVQFAADGRTFKQVQFTAAVDEKFNSLDRQVVTSGASQVSLSPDAKTFVFAAGNELWSVPVDQPGNRPNRSDARRLTDWAGLDESPIYTPDGKAIFFTSDREGSVRLYRMTLDDGKVVAITKEDEDVLELQLTPDRKHLSFWVAGAKGGLHRVSVDGGTPEKVIDLPRPYRYETDNSYAWSPDGRWVAYTVRRPLTSVNIFLYDTQTKTETNVTRLTAFHGQPVFSADGRYLYFVGQRDQSGIFVVPLADEPFRTADRELKYEKPKETPKVEVVLNGIHNRIRLFQSGEAGNLRFDAENGNLLFNRGSQVWQVGYDGEGARPLTSGSGIGSFEFSADGTKLVFVRDGLPAILELRRNNYPVRTVNFRGELVQNLNEVRGAAFAQFWREYNRTFYDPNFHGRDWRALRTAYEPFLASVGHANEFATVLNMLVGELDASHAEVSTAGGPTGVGSTSVGHLGLTFDYSHRGPGIKVLAVPANTPGSFEATRVAPGEFIHEINGRPARLSEELWRDILLGQAGRDVTLLIGKTADRSQVRTVTYRALGQGEWSNLLYENRIAARRAYVEEKSGGRLTYLEIPGMGGAQLRRFNFEAWEAIQGRQGVIIDVRNNGGGNISDDLMDLIERRPNYFFRLRDTEVQPMPDRSWSNDLKVVVLQSETSFSDAEIYPAAMKDRGFATLIGMPTTGYVIATYGLNLLDGTRARMPAWAVYRLDGTNMENQGQQPDIRVDWPVEDYLAGRDPQLDRAISELLRKIGR